MVYTCKYIKILILTISALKILINFNEQVLDRSTFDRRKTPQEIDEFLEGNSSKLTNFHQVLRGSVYSVKNTVKNGVRRSLIPWTYPLAGCRTAHTYRTRWKISWTIFF